MSEKKEGTIGEILLRDQKYIKKEGNSIILDSGLQKQKIGETKEEKETPYPTPEEVNRLTGEEGFKKYFHRIRRLLTGYMDLEEEYYSLISVWILGTYLHKHFSTYPYLFFNAMKGSGKTRLLKIISNLAYNGKVAGSMTEAVLFRTASQRTLCIDELENINSKGSENLKLLLNSAYKRGLTVERMTKRKTLEGEQQKVEEFSVYCPIALANIWGIDNTLSDRCISLILEKSTRKEITMLIENFEHEEEFQEIREGLTHLTKKFDPELDLFGDSIKKWNFFQNEINVSNVNNVNNVNNVSNVSNTKGKNEEHTHKTDIIDITDVFTLTFQKILNSQISGRDLEMFFSLFIISDICGDDVLDEIIKTSKKLVSERKRNDREDNRDVQLYEFVSQINTQDFLSVADLVSMFKTFLGIDETWINSRFLGRSLRRLNLVTSDRNTGKARQVKLNVEKAQTKLLMFKEDDE